MKAKHYVAIVSRPGTWFISATGYQHAAMYSCACNKLKPILDDVRDYTRDYVDHPNAYGFIWRDGELYCALREKYIKDQGSCLVRAKLDPDSKMEAEWLKARYDDLVSRGIRETVNLQNYETNRNTEAS